MLIDIPKIYYQKIYIMRGLLNRHYNISEYTHIGEVDVRVITLSRYDGFERCWVFMSKYPSINGTKIHLGVPGIEKYPLVRHLCCDNRCGNPLHLKGGTARENTNDETLKRYFKKKMKEDSIIHTDDVITRMYADLMTLDIIDDLSKIDDRHMSYTKWIWNILMKQDYYIAYRGAYFLGKGSGILE